MKKFYTYKEIINETTNQEIVVLKWWESSIIGCPTGAINSAKETLSADQQNIYNEYMSNPVLYDPEERDTDAESFPESTNPPA
jgi:hypothetical protein